MISRISVTEQSCEQGSILSKIVTDLEPFGGSGVGLGIAGAKKQNSCDKRVSVQ